MPMPSVRPPSDITLSEMFSWYIKRNVATTESGIEVAMMSVLRISRRKKNNTTMARRPPIMAESRTSLIDCSMKCDWSKRMASLSPSGSFLFHSSMRSRSACATLTVLASPSLKTAISMHSLPSTRVISSRSLVPMRTLATSRRRTAAPSRSATMTSPISSTESNSFSVRIRYWVSAPRSDPPGRLTLEAPMTLRTSSIEMPSAARRSWSMSM